MGEDKDTLVLWVEAIHVNRPDWSTVIADWIARTEARIAELEAQLEAKDTAELEAALGNAADSILAGAERINELEALVKQLSASACEAADRFVAERAKVAELEAELAEALERIEFIENETL